uniref:Unspecific monooxygenase n=1 Tax=Plectus sambesii TaxID=2011161 RepID=A0A914X2M1_9BILA
MLTIAVVFFVSALLYWIYSFESKRRKLPPGPVPLPLLGNSLSLIRAENGVDKLLEWGKTYGPVYTIWLGTMPAVFVVDYDIMQETFVKNADAYTGRLKNYAIEKLRGGNKGILLSDGNLWKEQRRFSLHVLRDFGVGRNIMEENILIEANAMNDGITAQLTSSKGAVINLRPFLDVCIGSIINALLFGYRFDEEKLEEFKYLKEQMDDLMGSSSQTVMFLIGPVTAHVPVFRQAWQKVLHIQEEIFGCLMKNIKEHRRTFDPTVEPTDFAYAYLKQIHQLQQRGESTENYSDLQFMNVALDLWLAGMETTVTTLKWAFLYLLHHPEVQDRIHKELDEVIGEDREITMADKPKLPYITATINEIQRCANILPINMGHQTTQRVTVGGYDIDEGTVIIPQISAVHMDEKHFPQPKTFDPSRFLEADGRTVKKVDQLMPFSLGKRQCMGESLARMELFLVFVNLVRKFKLSVPEGQPMPSLKAKFGMTAAPEDYVCWVSQRTSNA